MKKIINVLVFLCFTLTLMAGDETRKGTSGADQLLIPVGAKTIATGGALSSIIKGVEAIYYNPAGLDNNAGSEAMFNYMDYIADINVTYFAAGTHIEGIGSIAISYKSMDWGDINETTYEMPDGTGNTYSPTIVTAGLTYSKVLTDRVSAGSTIKIIHEGIQNTSATGIAIDFGVQYRFNPSLSLGAAIKNIGTNMRFTGEDLKVRNNVPGSALGSGSGSYEAETEKFDIPSLFELSMSYQMSPNEQNNVLAGTTFRHNNYLEDEMNFGLEYSFMHTLFLRGGYNLLLENMDQAIYDFTVGAGINYRTSGNLTIAFDYAFRNVKEFPTANHVFTLKLGIE